MEADRLRQAPSKARRCGLDLIKMLDKDRASYDSPAAPNCKHSSLPAHGLFIVAARPTVSRLREDNA